ncbi:MAG TPA: nucleotide exchange factor GrpE [Solirubrobacterales bacterium]|nr:nucleotide exchange factor GrpE [Solirubrobacterales bacterium]
MPSSRVSEEEQRRPEGAAGTADQVREEQPPPSEDERYLRARADLDNYRKRAAQEVERRVAERTERLLLEWIEAVDSVDRALGMAPSDGLRGVLEQMEAILARQGVERIGTRGDRFDPALHEAVAAEESDEVPEGSVTEVARSGYRRGERVLRPAQVVVSRRPPRGNGEI